MAQDEHLQDHDTTPEEQQAMWRKAEKIRFAMMTTRGPDAMLGSRPMTLQGVDGDGTLWFFTAGGTTLADDVHEDGSVNVSFADPKDDFYLSVSGVARFIDDREKIEALWSPMAAAWFDGPADPRLSLLRVMPERVDYWKNDAGRLVQMAALAKAALTSTRPGKGVGEHGSFVPPVAAGNGAGAHR
jgi:general stress protein 26